ncbi:hypothetical protein SAMN02799624_05229 [Paenibacillus sp. UNC496MF]|nr:hypothetical protein SAMN02799624_05229 [Paenibacillus sp. UNC496MF]
MPKANLALNAWSALKAESKSLYADAKSTWRTEAPLTTMLRKAPDRALAEDWYRKNGTMSGFKWKPGSISMGRSAALGLGGYAVADTVSRIGGGGGISRNAQGQRDLVGVPLI